MSRSSANYPAAARVQRLGQYELFGQLAPDLGLGPFFAGVSVEGSGQGQLVMGHSLPKGVLAWSRNRAMLSRGFEIAKTLRDGCLISVLDAVETDAAWIVFSEYLDAEPLSSVLASVHTRHAGLPPAVVARFGVELLETLRRCRDRWATAVALGAPEAALWSRRVFGGLLPNNILLTSDGGVLLAEAGLSGCVVGARGVRRHEGVLSYRAPEQLLHPEDTPDERADVFSLGVLLWELLAGRPLFGPGRELEQRVTTEAAPQLIGPGGAAAMTPAGLAEIVDCALSKSPSRRFRSFERMHEALRELPDEILSEPETLGSYVAQVASPAIRARRDHVRFLHGLSSRPPASDRATVRPVFGHSLDSDGRLSGYSEFGVVESEGDDDLRSVPCLEAPTARYAAQHPSASALHSERGGAVSRRAEQVRPLDAHSDDDLELFAEPDLGDSTPPPSSDGVDTVVRKISQAAPVSALPVKPVDSLPSTEAVPLQAAKQREPIGFARPMLLLLALVAIAGAVMWIRAEGASGPLVPAEAPRAVSGTEISTMATAQAVPAATVPHPVSPPPASSVSQRREGMSLIERHAQLVGEEVLPDEGSGPVRDPEPAVASASPNYGAEEGREAAVKAQLHFHPGATQVGHAPEERRKHRDAGAQPTDASAR